MYLCIYVWMYLCIDVFMYLCKTTNVYLCIYVILVLYNCCFVFLWFCVNPLSSSIPFVIDGYVNMLHLSCSLGTDGQDAILGLHAGLSHRAMRHKRVIVARLVINAQYALLARPVAIRNICILQYLRGL